MGKHFNLSIRMELSILLQKNYSYRSIAAVIKKSASAISREIKNNSVNGKYDPFKAHLKARYRRKYSKFPGMKIRDSQKLQDYIGDRLKDSWSPEQIDKYMKQANSGKTVISFKAIYNYCYSSYGQRLCKYLLHKRYKPKPKSNKNSKKELIPDRVFIDSRPKVVDKRNRFGDWEGDTLGAIKTDKTKVFGLVERKTRYLMLAKVPRLKYAMDGCKELLRPYHNLFKTLTLDNGVENIRYQELNVNTFFCHPYSSWEKPTIENSFGRLRRFIPKKTSLRNYSNDDIIAIVNKMNNTPRKCLNWETPKQVFQEELKKVGVAFQG